MNGTRNFWRLPLAAILAISACTFTMDDGRPIASYPGNPIQARSVYPFSNTVYFVPGTNYIDRATEDALRHWLHLQLLPDNSELQIILEGHASDARGGNFGPGSSLYLANIVRDRLVRMGVDAERIHIVGYREDLPMPPVSAPISLSPYRHVTITFAWTWPAIDTSSI